MPANRNDNVNACDKPLHYLKYATEYHAPVLCNAVIEGLITDKKGIYLDATLGGGGHTAALLDRLDGEARVIAIDQDAEAIKQAFERLSADVTSGRLSLVASNFAELEAVVATAGYPDIDGVLFDLGVSSHQLDRAERGFSHRFEGPLDMRMNTASPLTAEVIINTWSRSDLIRLFRTFGEEPKAVAIARAIEDARPITSTTRLAEIVRKKVPYLKEAKTLARIFQAIRIGVNEELNVLEEALLSTAGVLKEGGRLVVISYHSLEDRRVKRFLRSGNFEGRLSRDIYGNTNTPFRELNRKPVIASEEEKMANGRARSARLRVGERNPHVF